jgi:molybdopterin synthase sulfur carrier subunit
VSIEMTPRSIERACEQPVSAAKAESQVIVKLPRVLADLAACDRRIEVSGGTVAEALDDLIRRHAALGLHLFDDTGALRRHVLCFRNEVSVKSRAELDQPLASGDEVTLVNSVAGG